MYTYILYTHAHTHTHRGGEWCSPAVDGVLGACVKPGALTARFKEKGLRIEVRSPLHILELKLLLHLLLFLGFGCPWHRFSAAVCGPFRF